MCTAPSPSREHWWVRTDPRERHLWAPTLPSFPGIIFSINRGKFLGHVAFVPQKRRLERKAWALGPSVPRYWVVTSNPHHRRTPSRVLTGIVAALCQPGSEDHSRHLQAPCPPDATQAKARWLTKERLSMESPLPGRKRLGRRKVPEREGFLPNKHRL